MDMASGEYIAFADPDDYVEHSMYGRLMEEICTHDADVVACGYTSFSDENGSVLEELSRSPVSVWRRRRGQVFSMRIPSG